MTNPAPKWQQDLRGGVGIWFPSPCLQVMWSITWLVLVSPSRSAYPKVVHAHSNYVYKTCSMHQYDLVPLPPNFHHSSYFEPTNSKSEHQYYLPLCTVGASSTKRSSFTHHQPLCSDWQRCSSRILNQRHFVTLFQLTYMTFRMCSQSLPSMPCQIASLGTTQLNSSWVLNLWTVRSTHWHLMNRRNSINSFLKTFRHVTSAPLNHWWPCL